MSSTNTSIVVDEEMSFPELNKYYTGLLAWLFVIVCGVLILVLTGGLISWIVIHLRQKYSNGEQTIFGRLFLLDFIEQSIS